MLIQNCQIILDFLIKTSYKSVVEPRYCPYGILGINLVLTLCIGYSARLVETSSV
jgi:hypothetical protein